ncbi:MAG TPA: GYD domain-containing protein [Terriglobales bacterium]|nr:GYD domain-containing protein [Terriglobales bacterium]
MYDRQYTPKYLNCIMENPKTNRYEAAKNLIEATDGKLISMYSTASEGPGVLVIFDVPDPSEAPAISGTVVAAGHPQCKPHQAFDTGRNCQTSPNRRKVFAAWQMKMLGAVPPQNVE